MAKVFAVGVGPGSRGFLTRAAIDTIRRCDAVAGYRYTLATVGDLLEGKEIFEVTMKNQEETYQKLAAGLGSKSLLVPFTGDVNFSESEVVDRLVEIFGDVVLIPGISSVQIAASRARVPLDRSRVITMHVTGSIEEQKLDLQKALIDGQSVVLIPRPWPGMPEKHFMPSEIAVYLRNEGFDTAALKAVVFEELTTGDERHLECAVKELEGKEFSEMSVMVFDQHRPDSYMNYRWQWEEECARPASGDSQ